MIAGTFIDSYRIESQLGEGGMGTVYRALDTKLNRPVAIKFLSDELADAAARRRFQQEAKLASSLNHPHILTVYDVGEFEQKQYIVTEFVDGGTLKDWAKEPRSWKQIVELLTGVADGRQRRTRREFCIAISSQRILWWRRMATRSWPILVWRSSL